jgi:hypothetical protein
MANSESAPVTVYGNWGTLQIVTQRAQAMDAMGDTRGTAGPRRGPVERAIIRAEREFADEFRKANDGKNEVILDAEESEDLADNWLRCMRSREKPVYDVLKGYQVMVAIKLGVDSYIQGKTLAFDPATRKMLRNPPPRKVYLPPGA